MAWPAAPPPGSPANASPAPESQLAGPDRDAEAALEAERQARREAEREAQRRKAFEETLCSTRAEALREGEAAGRSRALAELQPALERLAASVADLAALRPRLRREAEADMLQLSLAIARRVLRRELAIDPEALHGLVLAALEKFALQELARVRVHPSHAAAVSDLLRQAGAGTAIEVMPDPTLDCGAALFETSRGSLDASVETQLQEIERGLADCLRRQP
jgi:flagellar assembly protein FliH